MKTRKDTLDEFVIKEQSGYKALFARAPRSGAVLDVGANIGAFANTYAKQYPALQFYSFEPEPSNYRLAVSNCSGLSNVHVHHAGLAARDGSMTLYVNEKRNKGLHSLIPTKGRSAVTVPVLSFTAALEKHQPTILKFDTEGSEYLVFNQLCNLPPCVRSIAIEIHLTKREHRAMGWALEAALTKAFPDVAKGGNLASKDIATYGAWATVFIGHR